MIQSLYKLAALACERGVHSQYVRAAQLLGAVHKLIGGREKIPIPKLNENEFLVTMRNTAATLGQQKYENHFRTGAAMSMDEVADFALSPRKDECGPRVG